MSDERRTMIERAFDLAGSGRCESIGDVRKQLRGEGDPERTLTGPSLLRQLRELCAASWRPPEGPDGPDDGATQP